MDIACKNFLRKFNSCHTFQSFYLKWHLKDFKSRASSDQAFETSLINDDGRDTFKWTLSMYDAEEAGKFLTLTVNKPVPVVFRILISAPGVEPFTVKCQFRYFQQYTVHKCWISENRLRDFLKNHEDPDVRCWIDIPNSVVIEYDHDDDWDEIDSATDMIDIYDGVVSGINDFSDVTLNVTADNNATHSFHCHRVILANRSIIFNTAFNKDKDKRVFYIEDIDMSTMKIILNFIYTGRLPIEPIDHDTLLKITYAAEKFKLIALTNWCMCRILISKPNYDFKNRVKQLIFADQHDLHRLKAICMAQMSMDLDAWSEEIGTFPDTLKGEILKEADKRKYNTKEIVE